MLSKKEKTDIFWVSCGSFCGNFAMLIILMLFEKVKCLHESGVKEMINTGAIELLMRDGLIIPYLFVVVMACVTGYVVFKMYCEGWVD